VARLGVRAGRNDYQDILAIASGAIGYKGLEYFRSAQGRADFTGKSVDELAQHPESSAVVIFSAAVWLVLLIASSMLGRVLHL
jgi:hypothetical protein